MRRCVLLATLAILSATRSPAARASALGLGEPEIVFSPSPGGFRLEGAVLTGEEDPPGTEAVFAPATPVPLRSAVPSPRLRKPLDANTVRVAGTLFLVTPLLGYVAWWRSVERAPFNFASEGWFQSDTYAGGADKASHVVFGYIGTRGLLSVYRKLGHPPDEARLLAFGTAAVTGALVEFGDGFSRYGFSWEDLVSNAAGSLAATVLDSARLDDTIGLRIGYVKALIPDPCCRYRGYGFDYSKEIHFLDIKLAGLLPRMKVAPGPARFFLLSLTYGTKGYRYSAPEIRQRDIGLDIGLNIPEILIGVGVSDDTWWGAPLLTAFRYVRLPYTAFGWRYDLNHGRWYGPDTGDVFAPGP